MGQPTPFFGVVSVGETRPRSDIRNNQLTTYKNSSSPAERRCSALSKQSDDSDGRREVYSAAGYTVPQQRILLKVISLKATDRCGLVD